MKKSAKVALSGVLCALSVVIMLTAYFPYLTYAIPAVSGALLTVIAIEIDKKWAFGAYLVSALLTILLCEKEAASLYVCFFGYYTIVKGIIEARFRGFLEYLFKFLIFNIAIVIGYLLVVYVFGIPFSESGAGGWLFAVGLLAVGNVVFFIYDRGLDRVIAAYIHLMHPKIKRMFK